MAKANGARPPRKATKSETPQADTARTETATSMRSAKSTQDNGRARPSREELQEAIRHRAYQLYCERGQQGGDPQEDWSRAEREVMAQYGRIA
jgi:hypothetical protein